MNKTITLPATLLKAFGSLIPTKADPFSNTQLLVDTNSKEMFVSNGSYLCRVNLESLELPQDISEDEFLEINTQDIKIALMKQSKNHPLVNAECIRVKKTERPCVKLVYEQMSDEINFGSPCSIACFDPKYLSTISKAFSCLGQDMRIEFPNDNLHCLKMTLVYNELECIALLLPRVN
jgi:hypothetical protein